MLPSTFEMIYFNGMLADVTKKFIQSKVVYQIPCNDCEAVYIGETKRTLVQRVQEHKRVVRNADTSKNETADHSWTKDHQFNYNEKKIIDQEKGWIARKMKETIHSIKNDKHINVLFL